MVGLPVVTKGLNMSDFLHLSSSFVLATFPINFQNQFLWKLKPYNNHIQFFFLLFFQENVFNLSAVDLQSREVGELVFFCRNKNVSLRTRSFGRTSTIKRKRRLQEKTF